MSVMRGARSFKRAGQPGALTRLLSCTEEQLKTYPNVDLVPTHVVPSLTRDPNPRHNDHYSAYNKPGAVLYWLRVHREAASCAMLASEHDACTRTHARLRCGSESCQPTCGWFQRI